MTFKELKEAGIIKAYQKVRLLISTQYAGLYVPTEPMPWYKIVSNDAFNNKEVSYISPTVTQELEIKLDGGDI